MSLLICMAMQGEADPVIAALGLEPAPGVLDPALPFRAWSGRRNGAAVHLAVSGRDARHGVDNIGTQPAALQAYVAMRAFAPAVVLSAGTCGGLESRGFRIGEVVAAAGEFLYHDRRVPIPGFEAYARGHYPAADGLALAAALGLRAGAVASGNDLETHPHDLAFFARHGVVAKEMEAASVAWVGGLLGVPVHALKAITDFVDHPASTAAQFEANFQAACAALTAAVVRASDWLLSSRPAAP